MSEQEEWATSGLTEWLQHELNDTQVRTEAAPYLAKLPSPSKYPYLEFHKGAGDQGAEWTFCFMSSVRGVQGAAVGMTVVRGLNFAAPIFGCRSAQPRKAYVLLVAPGLRSAGSDGQEFQLSHPP